MTIAVSHRVPGLPPGSPDLERRNPAAPDDLVSTAPIGDPGVVGEAVDAAAVAQPAWAAAGGSARAAVLARAAEVLRSREDSVALLVTREEGKTINEAFAEVRRTVDILQFGAALAMAPVGEHLESATIGTRVVTQRVPLGVIAAITPWNVPLAIPAWKVAPALAAGNAVVLAPSVLTPAVADVLAEVLSLAGLPEGVLTVVYGGASVAAPLCAHVGVAAVTFTGSVATGALVRVAVTGRGARLQMEMGGKNAVLVSDDADPTVAARIIAAGAFGLTGQACTATSRVVGSPAVLDRVAEALRAEVDRYQPGDGRNPDVPMGPAVDPAQHRKDLDYAETVVVDGGEVIASVEDRGGCFVTPGIVRAPRGARVSREEVFGPLVTMLEAENVDEAIEIMNDTPYGLSAGVVSHDARVIAAVTSRVEAGVIKVNRPTSGIDVHVPFGGIKASSYGGFREQGWRATDFSTRETSIYIGE